ncbi:MAG: hypothetical protein AMS18_16450 [Gemmatimonas sp. SG8_17]|nr:MAG: hypothetical protein AMS18_16450 [Gemmatimonas sp. SG8_17]
MNPTEVQTTNAPDPYWDMAVQAQASGMPTANVRIGFGDTVECLDPTGRRRWVKCEISVSAMCPQNEAFISHAKELMYQHAVQFVNGAMLRIIPDYTPIVLGG